MKSLLKILSIIFIFSACVKDKDPVEEIPAYEKRLIGNWTLTKVTYEAQMPSFPPGGPTTPVNGDGQNVSGSFEIARKPNTVNYDYSFTADVPVFGQTVTIPVEQNSEGTWTLNADNTRIYLDLENDNTTTLEVLLDEEKKQIFRTIIPYELTLLGTVDVTTTITLEK